MSQARHNAVPYWFAGLVGQSRDELPEKEPPKLSVVLPGGNRTVGSRRQRERCRNTC